MRRTSSCSLRRLAPSGMRLADVLRSLSQRSVSQPEHVAKLCRADISRLQQFAVASLVLRDRLGGLAAIPAAAAVAFVAAEPPAVRRPPLSK